jgi:hypothetical protein
VTDQSGWETYRGHDKLVTLRRLKPEEDIVINIETDPDVRATHITIPAVPKKQDCQPSQETKDAFGQVYERSLTSVDMDDLRPIDSDDGNGHKTVHWTVDVSTAFPDIGQSGVVSDVSCRKRDPTAEYHEVFSNGDPSRSTATCRAWYQNRGKFMSMTVKWFKKGYVCTDINWPVEATLDPSSLRKPQSKPVIKPRV